MLIATKKFLHRKLLAHQEPSGNYGPSRALCREFFSDEFGGLWSICRQNWCIGEDFNVIREEVEVRSTSDHSPVVLDSSPPEWGPSPFRFEHMLLDHKDFGKVFEVWWKGQAVHGWEGYKFLTRLHRIKGS
ncbi:hypothetical protein TorRG33x02_308330, partial [Trema orientale]